ncbi:MAG: penicillin acylase family protein, partial [Planctomycetes bacterium]|nr:penicillin acylase family protein [Planctomycetota bacterium]
MFCRRLVFLYFLLSGILPAVSDVRAAGQPTVDTSELAKQVKIYRDKFGVPHIFGRTDASTMFGFGYAQAEDFFWQVEDVYILALGRYAEVHGPKGVNSDLLNRAFEIVPRSRRDYAALDATSKQLYAAFVAGINYFLEIHPEVRPRLIRHFEPWHVLAYYRQVALELSFRFTGLSDEYLPRRNPHIWASTGSNGWVIGGKRTASGAPMLLANPHMPSFGFAQLAEAHLSSEGGPDGKAWNFIGAGFYGCPTLVLGHNERLGWTLVSNQPDIADLWRVRFSDPENPLAYEYDNGYRTADAWQEMIRVRKSRAMEERSFEFRKTHHGPIVAEEGDSMLAAKISGIFETIPLRQALHMMRAGNLEEFRQALSLMQILYMNVLYGDCDGNILFVYTGRIPRRNPEFDWSQPVDGSNPATEWLGYHALDELPQVLNPAAGFVQNCNSTPLMTTDGDNPRREDFPSYMIGDAEQRRRRALRSLEILRAMNGVTFEQWQAAAFDTEVYWAKHELPQYAEYFQTLQQENPKLAKRVQPYLEHLLAWDAKITADSTAATLCHAWYEKLYGTGYPGEQLRERYLDQPAKQLEALALAAERLQAMHGNWKVAYSELYRSQRLNRLADLVDARFKDAGPSLPALGGHGPMGSILTQYYTPSLEIPWVISQRKRYGLVGTSYLAAYEFTPTGVRGASLVPYGASGNPRSPHYFDQAKLL